MRKRKWFSCGFKQPTSKLGRIKPEKRGLTKSPFCAIIQSVNEREVIKMFYYEIRNTKTQETAQATAKNFATACRSLGWKPYECRCVWKANPENAGDPSQY
jgi:hypothetical protein